MLLRFWTFVNDFKIDELLLLFSRGLINVFGISNSGKACFDPANYWALNYGRERLRRSLLFRSRNGR